MRKREVAEAENLSKSEGEEMVTFRSFYVPIFKRVEFSKVREKQLLKAFGYTPIYEYTLYRGSITCRISRRKRTSRDFTSTATEPNPVTVAFEVPNDVIKEVNLEGLKYPVLVRVEVLDIKPSRVEELG